MTKRIRATCQGKVVDTINDDREIQYFRGEDGTHNCNSVIKVGKKLFKSHHCENGRYAVVIEGNIVKE